MNTTNSLNTKGLTASSSSGVMGQAQRLSMSYKQQPQQKHLEKTTSTMQVRQPSQKANTSLSQNSSQNHRSKSRGGNQSNNVSTINRQGKTSQYQQHDTTELSFVRALEQEEETSLIMTSSGIRNTSMIDSMKVSSTTSQAMSSTVQLKQIIDDSQYITNREVESNRQSVHPRQSLRLSAAGGKLGETAKQPAPRLIDLDNEKVRQLIGTGLPNLDAYSVIAVKPIEEKY